MPEKMTKVLTKREKIILYITIGIFIFAIIFNFLIMPVLAKSEKLNKEIILARAKLSKYLRLLSQKEYMQNKYSKFYAAHKIPGQQEDTALDSLSELENIAKNANIRIIDIRPQATRGSALYKETLIDLRTEGAMEGYLKFVYDIENSLLLLKIKRMQLASKFHSQALEGIFSISQLSSPE